MTSRLTKDLKTILRTKRKERKLTRADFVSAGATVLDMAISGRRGCGIPKGRMVLVVGDSEAGKSVLAMTILAMAANNPDFNEYRLRYGDAEGGVMMNLTKFYGKRLASRVEINTELETIEDMFDDVDDVIKSKKPFIYVVDSMDVLSSHEENSKFEEQKADRRKGRQVTGSMSDGKAKKNSAGIRRIVSKLRKTKSIYIVLAQTRDAMGFMAKFNPKTRSGGRAMKFYASVELWLSKGKPIVVSYKGKKRKVGITCQVQIKKNRISGKDRTVRFPILNSSGIDDISGCIQFLLEEKHWKKNNGVIRAKELGISGTEDELIKKIETKNLEEDLQRTVAQVWREIEDAINVERKRRFE